MPANGRWDLIRRLKVKMEACNETQNKLTPKCLKQYH
jgi:hypothetical protein